ncbi:RluA family pseudouridine synthase [Candidatus Phytoplasma solani]|uniref:Pseudouridine synthase n=1 Tax=Candidatus Phytoplasma solani TaxID=69896 RepID=A0A421NUV9_9MOLU|nr:RluA family pseudouridine synthase [Candidatus Phytoplasma solani]RMI87710.1 pseudouridylate synthase [Candidatus Phytoplasma solani]CCP88883.1 Pseudouridine synthase [Candidatus Phytoplasma solani]
MQEIQTWLISNPDAMQRLDHFLTRQTNWNKSKCQKLILAQKVLVNHRPTKKSYLLKPQDLITIKNDILETSFNLQKPYNLNLEIIYEDPYLAVINKPANLVVHPSLSFEGITLVNGLLHQIKPLSHLVTLRPGIVHRLDKNTTGLMLIAKTDEVSQKLQTAFKKRTIKKFYWGLIEGFLEDEGTINLPIGRNPNQRLKMAVLAKGKESITHFKTLKRFQETSLIEFVLETGRTHQIRVHTSYLKHPILGDKLYGSKHYNTDLGQFLHAKELIFCHPITSEKIQLQAPLPLNFKNLIQTLKNT